MIVNYDLHLNPRELLTTTEGLLYIKATSEQNESFPDKFKNKPQVEATMLDFIQHYQFSEEEHQVRYNQPQQAAIAFVISKMIEYGYPVSEIDKVSNSILHAQNAYINKENMKLVRLVNRMNRRGEHVSDGIIKQFVSLANSSAVFHINFSAWLTVLCPEIPHERQAQKR